MDLVSRDLEKAGGDELELRKRGGEELPPKLHAEHSSAALVVNQCHCIQ